MAFNDGDVPRAGNRVRDRVWGGTQTGRITRTNGRRVYIKWDGTWFTEDELDMDEIDPV